MKNSLFAAVLCFGMATAPAVWACGGAASGKHMGEVVAIDADAKTFTIRDAETNSPITFTADANIVAAVEKGGRSVMVNYEETDEGGLRAVGVTF